ncbi:hypothetical protein [Dolosigranulum savutiense]|uniref:Uncharacterized protein n=1 Tax=Dolosigranulum savutiense TaxID=3110288 RepID=A0AB74TSR7_9LACT
MVANKQIIELKQYRILHNHPAEHCVIDSLQDRVLFLGIERDSIHLIVEAKENKLAFHPGYGVYISYLEDNQFEVEVEEYD